MKKNPQYWNDNFNILGVVHQFNNEFKKRYNESFYGKLNLIIYKRELNQTFNDLLFGNEFFLNGYLPNKKNENIGFDFLLTIDKLIPFNHIYNSIKNEKLINNCVIFQIEVTKDPKTELSVVSIIKSL